jgi:sugar (pentulose or hexulose) kinase
VRIIAKQGDIAKPGTPEELKKSGSSEKIYLILDIGTSDIKCACINSNYEILTQHRRKFPMVQNQGTIEIDFDLFFKVTIDLLMECLADRHMKRSKIRALLITSQAQTFAPVDAYFSPIYQGIVWLDERADKEAAYLNERLSNFARAAGFKRPLPSLYISKLLWLKKNESAVFKKARAFPLINEYLVYRLTGEFYSDSTNFGMGGMYDYRRNAITTEPLRILDLTKDFFPKIEKAMGRGELISQQIQREWKLSDRFPVFLCGNDQGASACGAGLKQPGDMNINFGTAMVFYTISDSLITDLTDDQIAGKHPVGDDYFLLNLESDFGMQMRRLKERFFKNYTYDRFFQTYIQYTNVNEQRLPSRDADLNFASQADSHRLCAGVIKYYLNRLRFHLKQIQKSVQLKNITLSGGMMLSDVWLDILHNTLNQPFTINNRANAGVFGALTIYLQNNKGKICDD